MIKYDEGENMVVVCRKKEQAAAIAIKSIENENQVNRMLDKGWPKKEDINEIPTDEIGAYLP